MVESPKSTRETGFLESQCLPLLRALFEIGVRLWTNNHRRLEYESEQLARKMMSKTT